MTADKVIDEVLREEAINSLRRQVTQANYHFRLNANQLTHLALAFEAIVKETEPTNASEGLHQFQRLIDLTWDQRFTLLAGTVEMVRDQHEKHARLVEKLALVQPPS